MKDEGENMRDIVRNAFYEYWKSQGLSDRSIMLGEIQFESEIFEAGWDAALKSMNNPEIVLNAERYKTIRSNAYRYAVGNPTSHELDQAIDEQIKFVRAFADAKDL